MSPPQALQTQSDEYLMCTYCAAQLDAAAAFDTLYARHEAGLYRFVRRVLGARLNAQADEVFQDCWLRIISARDSFSAERGRWKTWAYTVAHHLALDRLRVSGRELSVDQLDSTGHDSPSAFDWLQTSLGVSGPGPSPDELVHWRAAGQQLLQCLDALPAAQRAAFLLHHEDGAALEDMAQALGLGFETVKSRLRYALQKLKSCMAAYLVPGALT